LWAKEEGTPEMMAEAEDEDEIFVYIGGEQLVPDNVRRVRIDKSVKIIPARAFQYCRSLIFVEFHDGIERIEMWAFYDCPLLSSVKLLGVKIIKDGAFRDCSGLTDVELGDKLETIGQNAFSRCTSLRSVTIPSVRTIGEWAFSSCIRLTDLDLPEDLDRIGPYAFYNCTSSLRRIVMPLKDNMIEDDVFYECPKLSTVDLVGGIHKTIASLHLESWRNDMIVEIDRINQLLFDTPPREKTAEIQQWISLVLRRIARYKSKHNKLLKEATTLLELALWKANLDERKRESLILKGGKGKVDIQSERNESRIKSGASIVIKNVLPFLTLV
jgi:hypothetical protein